MTTRERLHQLIDSLPECILEASEQAFLDLLKKVDPVAYAFFTAPIDDEEETEEERKAVEEAYDSIARSRAEKPWLGREISAVKRRRTESGTIAVRAGPRRKWP